MNEEIAIWTHQYKGFWDDATIRSFAVAAFCHTFRQWILFHGWRKPPNWTGGSVPLSRLWPKGGTFPLERYAAFRKLVHAKYVKGGDSDV